ncbi:Transmembrane protein [Bacteroides ovatus]|nr:Transmembrane protein [Bacteroides ovatus]
MEEKQIFPRATGFSGKILIALLFILSGILLFARNMGWITSEVFDLIVSWHSLLILLGIYAMIRRHFIGGIILLLIGVYFLIGGLSWLPEKFAGNGMAPRSDNSRCFIYLQTRQK